MSYSINLRKLTWRSVLNFGQYNGMSIHQVYSLGHTPYLRWVYYNCSKMTFTEEILDKIYIRPENRISKPGKSPELHCKLCDIVQSSRRKKLYEEGNVAKLAIEKNRNKSVQRKKLNKSEMKDRERYSKRRLQMTNHGKPKY